MPEGRFLSKSIAWSEQVASVSLLAECLFVRLIPHLDREGRLSGSPAAVKAIVCPLRSDITPAHVAEALAELTEAGLIIWYTVAGQKYLECPGFKNHQRGARFDREAASRIPSSTHPDAELIRTNSGPTPDRLPLREGKASEGEVKERRSEEIGASVDAPARRRTAGYPAEFEAAWLLYPRRDGSNPKRQAAHAWSARIGAGVPAHELHDGVVRYAAWVRAKGKENTEAVMQARRFFGPGEEWRNAWTPTLLPHSSVRRSVVDQMSESMRTVFSGSGA
jgi:hypothetical protein